MQRKNEIMRKLKGLQIASTANITHNGNVWLVPSQYGYGFYSVVADGSERTCSCPDFELTGYWCKHIHAVELILTHQVVNYSLQGTPIPKPSYKQDWSLYNKGKFNELKLRNILLPLLVQKVTDPRPKKRGRPRLSFQEQLICAIQKSSCKNGSRESYSIYLDMIEHGYISRVPNWNSVNKFLERSDITPILQNLVALSSSPLIPIETSFAIDSTGFRTSSFSEYRTDKYGFMRDRKWIKLHAITGVKTNIIPYAVITTGESNDTLQFPTLVQATDEIGFHIKEVSADKAYSSRLNVEITTTIGAEPYIPCKSNVTGRAMGSPSWARVVHRFMYERETVLPRYHLRSNVESTFGALKMKYGDNVKSKQFISQANELLCKVIAYNLSVVIAEMFEIGIAPEFMSDF